VNITTSAWHYDVGMANQPKRFKAMLERGTEGLGWTIARLPFDPHKAWTKMQRLRVRGKVLCPKGPSIEFRTPLFPVPGESGHHLLLVNNRVQREARIGVGSVAEFLLEADLEPRPAELPPELASLLDEEPGLRDYYDSLSESMRREIGKWVMKVEHYGGYQKYRCRLSLWLSPENRTIVEPVIRMPVPSRLGGSVRSCTGWFSRARSISSPAASPLFSMMPR
jgi:hypothetical protein